jgi:hypothetical protein
MFSLTNKLPMTKRTFHLFAKLSKTVSFSAAFITFSQVYSTHLNKGWAKLTIQSCSSFPQPQQLPDKQHR